MSVASCSSFNLHVEYFVALLCSLPLCTIGSQSRSSGISLLWGVIQILPSSNRMQGILLLSTLVLKCVIAIVSTNLFHLVLLCWIFQHLIKLKTIRIKFLDIYNDLVLPTHISLKVAKDRCLEIHRFDMIAIFFIEYVVGLCTLLWRGKLSLNKWPLYSTHQTADLPHFRPHLNSLALDSTQIAFVISEQSTPFSKLSRCSKL